MHVDMLCNEYLRAIFFSTHPFFIFILNLHEVFLRFLNVPLGPFLLCGIFVARAKSANRLLKLTLLPANRPRIRK